VANTFSPIGFQDWNRVEGAAINSALATRYILPSNATAIYFGDPVVTNGGYIQQATTGATEIAGVFRGCEYYSIAAKQPLFLPYWPGTTTDVQAGTVIRAKIVNDPQARFLCQVGNYTSAVGIASVMDNIGIQIGTGTPLSGQSGAYVDGATIATTATLPFRIIDLFSNYGAPGTNGADSTTPYGYLIVGFNNQELRNSTGV